MFVSVALWFSSDSSDSDDAQDSRIQHRKLRDATNVFEIPEDRFHANFRVNKEVFRILLREIESKFKKTYRITYIPPVQRLAMFLLFIGSGGHQNSIRGNERVSFMSQPQVSKVISECLEIFEKYMCPKWITLDKNTEDESKTKLEFYRTAGIPGVVGCVGGTHIRIKAPGEDVKQPYYNRKEYYSVNVMAICDHNMTITFVDATNPGSIPDATVWDNSEAHQYFNSYFIIGKNNTWLLGNSAFKLQPYMITPYRNPIDERQENFNESHSKTYSIIERCFDTLRDRFRCMMGYKHLQYSPQKTATIVNACCALHNICNFYKNSWLPLETAINTKGASFEIAFEEDSETAHSLRDDIASSIY